MVAFQWFHALNARSRTLSLFQIGLWSNGWLLVGVGAAVALQVLVVAWPPAHALFHTTTLTWGEWGRVLAVASSIFVIDEIRKLLLRGRPGEA
jgi:Ca2+-transporting ATPase